VPVSPVSAGDTFSIGDPDNELTFETFASGSNIPVIDPIDASTWPELFPTDGSYVSYIKWCTDATTGYTSEAIQIRTTNPLTGIQTTLETQPSTAGAIGTYDLSQCTEVDLVPEAGEVMCINNIEIFGYDTTAPGGDAYRAVSGITITDSSGITANLGTIDSNTPTQGSVNFGTEGCLSSMQPYVRTGGNEISSLLLFSQDPVELYELFPASKCEYVTSPSVSDLTADQDVTLYWNTGIIQTEESPFYGEDGMKGIFKIGGFNTFTEPPTSEEY
jgi:hypothetical protein